MNLTLIVFGHLNTDTNTSVSMPLTHSRTIYEDLLDPLDPSKIPFFDQARR